MNNCVTDIVELAFPDVFCNVQTLSSTQVTYVPSSLHLPGELAPRGSLPRGLISWGLLMTAARPRVSRLHLTPYFLSLVFR